MKTIKQPVQCNFDAIIIGAVGTAALMVVAFIFGLTNRNRNIPV